jgi:nucleotide-binding universal stress UspA family protein
MYRKILVPLDGSGFAESALPLALSVAERTGGELHLATVVSTIPPFVFSEGDEGYVKGWFEEERGRAREYLAAVRERLEKAAEPAGVQTRILEGGPAPALDEHIRDEGMDLVVMTTHGRGAFQRLWLGSVADGLIRHAPCPMLLRRPGDGEADLAARPAFQRIVLPLDGSKVSEAMLPSAAEMARLFEARLLLVSVLPPAFPLGSTYLPHAAEEERKRKERAAELRSYLERTKAELREQKVEAEAEVVADKEPAEAILDHAERVAADLVAMSTHGRGGVARMVLGSVADKVIRAAAVSVFVRGGAIPEGA